MALSSVKCIGVSFIEESEIIISEATKNTSAVLELFQKWNLIILAENVYGLE